jgi:hypothetical protein
MKWIPVTQIMLRVAFYYYFLIAAAASHTYKQFVHPGWIFGFPHFLY